MQKSLIALIAAAAFVPIATADTLVSFDFNPTDIEDPGNIVENVPYDVTGVLDSDVALTQGLLSSGASSFDLDAWRTFWNFTDNPGTAGTVEPDVTSLALAIQEENFISFALTPTAGRQLDLDAESLLMDVGFVLGSAGSAPDSSQLLISNDGMFDVADAASSVVTPASGTLTYDIAGAGFDGLAGDVEFRIYVWNANGTPTNSVGFALHGENPNLPGGSADGIGEGLLLTGSTSLIPEPASLGLLAAAGLGLLRRRA